MGMYISQSDIENNWGATNVAQWASYTPITNPALNTAAIQQRITTAINMAEAQVNVRLSMSPYAVPVVATGGGVPFEITNMCAELAGIWLWNTRSLKQSGENQSRMVTRGRDVRAMLLQIIAGTYPLAANPRPGRTNTPFSVGGCR